MLRVYEPETSRSRRLLRVVLPDSRLLKWPWPPLRFKSFPLLVIFMRLATVLEVFCFIWVGLGLAPDGSSYIAARTGNGLFDGELIFLTDTIEVFFDFVFGDIPVLFLATAQADLDIELVSF